MKLQKLNTSGVIHWTMIAPVAVIILVAAIGLRTLNATHAATPASIGLKSNSITDPSGYKYQYLGTTGIEGWEKMKVSACRLNLGSNWKVASQLSLSGATQDTDGPYSASLTDSNGGDGITKPYKIWYNSPNLNNWFYGVVQGVTFQPNVNSTNDLQYYITYNSANTATGVSYLGAGRLSSCT